MYLPLLTLFFSLAAASPAATTNSFCSSVARQSCQSAGTSFCSSLLKVPSKTTTATHTVFVGGTTTVTSGTTTDRVTVKTATSTYTGSTTRTIYTEVPSTSTVYTATVVVTTYSTTIYYDLPNCTNPPENGPAIGKRGAETTPTTKPTPTCLAPFSTQLSSACHCLSIPTTTKTVSTITKTVTSKTTVDVPHTQTTDVTVTLIYSVGETTYTTQTLTDIYVTSVTTTSTATEVMTATASSFYVNAVQDGMAYINASPVYYPSEEEYILTFNTSASPAIFTLTSQTFNGVEHDCVLTVVSTPGSSMNFAGWEAFIESGTTFVSFANPNTSPYPLVCGVVTSTGELLCESPFGGPFGTGYVVNNELNYNVTNPTGVFVSASPVSTTMVT